MSSPVKVQGTTLLTLQQLTSGNFLVSTPKDVSSDFSATISIHIGRSITTALSAPVNIRVMANALASGTNEWFTLAKFQSGTGSADTEVLASAGNEIGATSLTTTGGTWNSNSDGSYMFVLNSTVSNSEWVRAGVHSTDVMPIMDPLTFNQNDSNVFDQAEEYIAQLDLTSIGIIRVEIDTFSAGQTIYAEAFITTCTSIV